MIIAFSDAGRGDRQRVRGGAGLRVRAADIRGVAPPDLPLHQGRGRPLRHRHLLLGQLRQGWVSACAGAFRIRVNIVIFSWTEQTLSRLKDG